LAGEGTKGGASDHAGVTTFTVARSTARTAGHNMADGSACYTAASAEHVAGMA
jgi:hypothetical protein